MTFSYMFIMYHWYLPPPHLALTPDIIFFLFPTISPSIYFHGLFYFETQWIGFGLLIRASVRVCLQEYGQVTSGYTPPTYILTHVHIYTLNMDVHAHKSSGRGRAPKSLSPFHVWMSSDPIWYRYLTFIHSVSSTKSAFHSLLPCILFCPLSKILPTLQLVAMPSQDWPVTSFCSHYRPLHKGS